MYILVIRILKSVLPALLILEIILVPMSHMVVAMIEKYN